MIRPQVNRLVVAAGLLAGLPAVAVAERVRRGSGRRVAVVAVRAITAACGVRFVVEGAHHLGDRHVLVPNHSSPMDIPALLVAVPGVRFVAAEDLYGNPLLAAAMRALDTVAVNRGNARRARRQLGDVRADHRPLVIFPEGGIPPRGQRRAFKGGAFAVAIDAGAVVVPVAIDGSDDVLPPGARLALRPGTVRVRILDPIATEGLGRRAVRERAEAAVLDALA